MNERIWELWHQATLDPTNEDSPDLVEKFAELIVQECAQVCRSQSNEYALEFDRENCAAAIEEHFGVK